MINSDENLLRFSGHDTFHCKEQWLLKGVQLIENQGSIDIFKKNEAIPILGVGKNMVRSINHWLKSFGLINNKNEISKLSKLLFLEEKFDSYLENEGTLWLLHYYLCKTNYSSIYKLIFSTYFSDKATLDFTEHQIINFINRQLLSRHQKLVVGKTLNSDYKVFIRTYIPPSKNEKTIEDDFSAPLISLNLISDTGRKNSLNQSIYRVNKDRQQSISVEIFAYCLIDEFSLESSVSYEKIKQSIGNYFCLSNEGLELIIDNLCQSYSEFVFKDDAGVKQIQFKNINQNSKIDFLKKHYELQQ